MAVSKKALLPCWPIKWKNSHSQLLQACICCLLGCTTNNPDSITGTYTAEWTNEFYMTRDTLQITILNSKKNNFYQVARRTMTTGPGQVARRTMTTGPGQPHYQLLRWIGEYFPQDKTFRVSSNGRIIVFDPATGNLIMGTSTYKKL